MKHMLTACFAALSQLGWVGACTAAESPRAMRDPMQPPALASRVATPEAQAPAPAAAAVARHLITIDGRRYVIDGNRRRAVGDLLGDARIERIEDDAVVVRNAAGTQRLPLFGSVLKQAAADLNTTPSVTSRSDRLPSSGEPR